MNGAVTVIALKSDQVADARATYASATTPATPSAT